MHRSCLALSVLSLAATLAAQATDLPRVEVADLVRHYTNVEAELRAAPLPADPEVAARRLQALDHLHTYRERAEFGRGPASAEGRIPLFVDAEGRRCAVAFLLDHTGHGDVTLDIHRRRNRAWVAELLDEPALGNWLTANGLTVAEAARIQGPHVRPTVMPPPRPPRPLENPDGPDWRPGDAMAPDVALGSGGTARSRPRPNGAAAAAGRSVGSTPRGTRTPRGIALDQLDDRAIWLDWWEWNRGQFEQPEARAVVAAPAGATTDIKPADPRRADAERVLRQLAKAPASDLRLTAVQALGRMGVAAGPSLEKAEAAQAVRMVTMLGLGATGLGADVYELAAQAAEPLPGEALAMAMTAMTLLDDGAAKRSFTATIERRLHDKRPDVFLAAAMATSTRPLAERRAVAIGLLRGGANTMQRAECAWLLGRDAADDDVAVLTALASDKSPSVRRAAAGALGRSKHPLALPALQTAFELEHEGHTLATQLLAIGDHGGDAARPFLTKVLASGKKPLRAFAALGLGLWGRGRADKELVQRLETGFQSERNRDQQGAYLLALGLLQHAPAHDLLARTLGSHAKSDVRAAAATGLGLMGSGAALPALQRALADDSCPFVRQQSARALQLLGKDAFEPLHDALRRENNPNVRQAIAVALGGLADVRAGATLLGLVADATQPAEVRAGAALGLGRHFRAADAKLPGLRFMHDFAEVPAITAWALTQEL
ncbi:MAG: HEAT repeat domain-containing protein [Planctomycetes bacterium]|nr:HEAT repeat domain-containing protein [Planctomycetota bacterium]